MNTGVKRSLFTKPAWAAPATTSSSKLEDGGSVFGRQVAYTDIVQAEQAKRERKAAKARLHAAAAKVKSSVSPSATKRRKISVEPQHDEGERRGSDSKHDADPSIRRSAGSSRRTNGEPVRQGPVTRSTPQKNKILRNQLDRSPGSRTHHASLRRDESIGRDEDEDEDNLVLLTPAKTRPRQASRPKPRVDEDEEKEEEEELEEDSDEDDPYLRELKQKAREKSRLQRLGLDRTQSPSPASGPATANATTTTPNINTIPRALSSKSRPVSAAGSGKATAASEHAAQDDPQVKILIQSDIPGTNPLIVVRKASQSLKQVREVWCQKWELDNSVAKLVFFTWRGTRLFDSTTMRGIIDKLKKDHRQRSTGLNEHEDDEEAGHDDYDPSKGNIMLEAMTPDIYEEKMRQKEQQQQHDQNSADEERGSDDEEGAAGVASSRTVEHEAAAGAIVIRLVSRVYDPMPLRVRQHTTVAKIMRGYAATKRLENGKTPWLIFDGERLDPEATVENVGLEDEDEVEVSIR